MPEEIKRSYLHFDTGDGKPVSWLRRVLARLGFCSLPPPGGIPDDAVITSATLSIYVNEEADDE